MGWTYTAREKGVSDREFFQREFASASITDIARGKQGVVWVRFEREREGQKLAFVCAMFTKWAPRDRYNFGYKDVDESMGPYAYDCPLRMLEGLSEPCSEASAKWRELVRLYHAERANRPKLEFGDVLKFESPLSFGRFQADTFRKVRHGKLKNIFEVVGGPNDGAHIRLTAGVLDRGSYQKIENSPATV